MHLISELFGILPIVSHLHIFRCRRSDVLSQLALDEREGYGEAYAHRPAGRNASAESHIVYDPERISTAYEVQQERPNRENMHTKQYTP